MWVMYRLAFTANRNSFGVSSRQRSKVASYLGAAQRLVPELRDPFALERITVPVLLIWGDRDRIVFHRGAKRVLDVVPDSRLELLKGVGHCPQVEAPARFAELVLEFAGKADLAVA